MLYLLIFCAVLVEGPIATLAAAALAVQNPDLKVVYVFAAASLGNLTADLCWYLLGSISTHGRVLAYIPWVRCQEGLVKRATREIQRRGLSVFILTKLGFGVGTIPLLIAAGMVRINRKQWFITAVCTEIIWTGTLLLAGIFAGKGFHRVAGALFENALLLGTVAMVIIVAFILYKNLTAASHRTSG